MCGIIGAVAQRDVIPILIEGLKRLEYRGYDSAGVVVLDREGQLRCTRVSGKVDELEAKVINNQSCSGGIGLAHTRWATHGVPSIENAHPHIAENQIALVHNGIIENYEELRKAQTELGYRFSSDTDSETVVNQIHYQLYQGDTFLTAVQNTLSKLQGTCALGVVNSHTPDRMIAACRGSPLVIGVGIGEYFIASDIFALLPVTQRFIILEDGDIAEISRDQFVIYDRNRTRVERSISVSEQSSVLADKGGYQHYMLKEIFFQPEAVMNILYGRLLKGKPIISEFGNEAEAILRQVENVKIVACGTSYHAGLVAKYWLEEIAGLPCDVEVASEFRYRPSVMREGTFFLGLSQSGETADTLAALALAKQKKILASMAICNVAQSALTREADLVFLLRSGIEIGVASTKTFTNQLVGLFLLVLTMAELRGHCSIEKLRSLGTGLEALPSFINQILSLGAQIREMAEKFSHKQHAFYLGRGLFFPIAMEGALKLKEISYIHAEAYPAGELKHGPLALIDDEMPVIVLLPDNALLTKLQSNIKEVQARGGQIYIFTDADIVSEFDASIEVLKLPSFNNYLAPILYTIPLQLLAYYVAIMRGADVDQPRNLAKSVTVE